MEKVFQQRGSRRQQRGFSLIELLIVVALILIITALAVPNFLKSRMAANEATTASAMKTIGTANVVYFSLYQVGYAGALAHLGPPGGACASISSGCAGLIDSVISGVNPATATPTKNGYRFTYYAPNPTPTQTSTNRTWSIVTSPVTPGTSGLGSFCFDFTNVLWKDSSGATTTAAATGCQPTWAGGGNIAPN